MKVIIYTYEGVEKWSPETVESRGSGASEYSIVKLAKGLHKLGHSVTVYASELGKYDGINYIPSSYYSPVRDPCDVFIASRVPSALNKTNAGIKILWCHDISYDTLTSEVKVDKVVCSTNWHANKLRDKYPFLESINVVELGIDPELYPESIKCKHKFIWTSMPQRGLYELLQMWPYIKNMWQDASLDIYYGWDVYDKLYTNTSSLVFKWKIINKIARSKDVVWHGRVSKKELINKFLESDYWYYPSNYFEEVFCLSALEAQASGCLCVARDNGCLREVVGDRGIVFPNENTVNIQLEALQKAENNQRLREEARKWALTCTWDSVVSKWDSLIRGN